MISGCGWCACLEKLLLVQSGLVCRREQSCLNCVCEQYQIAMFHMKSSVETSQDAQTRFPTCVSHLEEYLGSRRSCGLTGDARR